LAADGLLSEESQEENAGLCEENGDEFDEDYEEKCEDESAQMEQLGLV
jgi:hypothetical protein